MATGPQGSVTLNLRGKREYMTTPKGASYIQETGTWTLGKVNGYQGVQLAKSGTYKSIITTPLARGPQQGHGRAHRRHLRVLELRRHLGPALAAGAIALAGCGTDRASSGAPDRPRLADREWVDNASRFVQQLQQDISMSAAGGSNLASARRAVSDLDAVYLLLVAYGDFGDCNRELAATGRPGPHGSKAAALILSACRPLERCRGAVRAGDAAERPPGAPRRDADLGDGGADSRAGARRTPCAPVGRPRYSMRGRERSRWPAPPSGGGSRPPATAAVRILVSALVWAFVLGNVAALCWLWVANHNLDFSFAPNWWATLWSRLGGLTGLLGGFLALVQVLLLARLPFLAARSASTT